MASVTLCDRFAFRLEREKAILVNEVALVQKERDDHLLMAENEKQEVLHAAANEKGTLLERLNKTQNDLENANVEIDRIKRDAFSRAEQDKVTERNLIDGFFSKLSVIQAYPEKGNPSSSKRSRTI